MITDCSRVEGISVLDLGGSYDPVCNAFLGIVTEQSISRLRVDMALLSAGAIRGSYAYFHNPEVARAGVRRTQGRPPEQKEAVLPEDLLKMIATLDLGDLRGLRDRAMLLIGFAGGLRRSEIVGLAAHPEDALDGGWVEFFADGLLLTLRGKTGWREVEIGRGSSEATCPVSALETWLKFARIERGPLFRKVLPDGKRVGAEPLTDKHVARLVKRTALAAGVRGDLSEGRAGSGNFPGIPCAPASPPRPKSTSATCKNSWATPLPK